MSQSAALRCLEADADCAGPVQPHTASDRRDGRAFPRCQHHIGLRKASAERTRELRADTPPDWFDPLAAGERWNPDI